MIQKPESDKELMTAISEGDTGTIVWFDAKCYIKTTPDIWERWDQTNERVKSNFPNICQKEIINRALDWINKGQWENGVIKIEK